MYVFFMDFCLCCLKCKGVMLHDRQETNRSFDLTVFYFMGEKLHSTLHCLSSTKLHQRIKYTTMAAPKNYDVFPNAMLHRGSLSRGHCNLSHVTSVGEVVIARAHVTVLPRLFDAETRWVAGGWGVVKLCL